jgi:hypothetical protein
VQVEACTYEVSDEAMAATPSLRGGVIARLRRTRAVVEAQLQDCRTTFQEALGDGLATVHEGSQPPSAWHPAPDAITAGSNSAGRPIQPSFEGYQPAQLDPQHGSLPAAAALEAHDMEMGSVDQNESSRASSNADGSRSNTNTPPGGNEAVRAPSQPVALLRAQPPGVAASLQGFVWVRNSCGPDFLATSLAACLDELRGAQAELPLGELLARMASNFAAAQPDSRLQGSILGLVYPRYASLVDRSWSPGSFSGMPTLLEAFGPQLGSIHEAHAVLHGECQRCGATEETPRTFNYISLVRIPGCVLNPFPWLMQACMDKQLQ